MHTYILIFLLVIIIFRLFASLNRLTGSKFVSRPSSGAHDPQDFTRPYNEFHRSVGTDHSDYSSRNNDLHMSMDREH